MNTTTPINPAQLSYEMGRAGLNIVGPDDDGIYVVVALDESATVEDLEAAVAAHVADPGWVCPDPEPRQPLDEFGRLLTLLALYEGQQIPPAAELAAMGGYTEADLQAEFYAWLDAGQAGL